MSKIFTKKNALICLTLTSLLSAQNSNDNPFFFDDEEPISVQEPDLIAINNKTAIKGIADPLKILDNVRGVYFNWKNDEYSDDTLPTSRQTGVVTEDLSAVLPGSYKTTSDGKQKLKSEAIIALLIEAVKEQKVMIDELQSDLIRLKTDLKQTDHEKTNYLNHVQKLQDDMTALKELIGNPVVNVHFHYDDDKKKKGKRPKMTSHDK